MPNISVTGMSYLLHFQNLEKNIFANAKTAVERQSIIEFSFMNIKVIPKIVAFATK